MNILILHKWLVTGGIERVLTAYLPIFQQLGYQVDLSLKYCLEPDCTLYRHIPDTVTLTHFADAVQTQAMQQQKQNRKSSLKNKLRYEWRRVQEQQHYRRYLTGLLCRKTYDCVIDFSDCLDDIMRFPKWLRPGFPSTLRWVHLALSDQAVLNHKQRRRFTAVFQEHGRVVSICETMQKQIWHNLPLPHNHTVCLHNPLDLAAIRSQAGQTVRPEHQALLQQPFLFQAARLEPVKNLTALIEIYGSLKTQHGIPHKLYIAGEGSLKDVLQQKIQALGLQQDCLLLGNLDNPYPFFQAASLFVHTSEREGLPTVLLESMACGTPVVAMDCPTGPADILGRNSEYGKLIPLHDRAAFIEAVCLLLQNDEIHKQYCQAALKRSEDFSLQAVAQQLASLLDDCILKKNKP